MHLPKRRYNRNWGQITDLDIELRCFSNRLMPEQGGLGPEGHFRNVVGLLWPEGSAREFIWHPWAKTMLEASCAHRYLSVSGSGGCGKSQFFAMWGLVNWMADPLNTLVIMTSTSMSAARKRIWGSVKDYFLAAKDFMPGRLVDAVGLIRSRDTVRNVDGSDRCGITLVAGEKGGDRNSQEKVMGMHNKRVILIGDELPDLSPALVQVAMGNLKTNPWYQFIGIGNPKSMFDPHGEFSQPKAGWKAITEKDEEWATHLGHAIRFDATKSPNIRLGYTKYPFLPTKEGIQEAVEHLGEDSPQFWRMWRGYWCPGGGERGIYSDAEIEFSGSTEKEIPWDDTPIPVASIDLGFTSGGDLSMAVAGLLGMSRGVRTLLLTAHARFNDDVSVAVPRMDQIANKFIAFCKAHGVQPQHAGFDGTGGGTMFGEALYRLWDGSVNRIDFSGGASELPHGSAGLTGLDLFTNRSSEIWICGKDYLHAGQLRGIVPQLAREMIARNAESVKSTRGMRQQVEPKCKFKKRTGASPDLADAYFIMLDVCRNVLGFRSAQNEASNKWAASQWAAFVAKQEAPEKSATPPSLEMVPVFTSAPQWRPEPAMEEGWGGLSFY